MQPLNRAERNHTFLVFVLFFSITIALIACAFFFSSQVSSKETEQLRTKVIALQNEKELSDSFSVAMKEAMSELSKFDIKSEANEPRQPTIAIKRSAQFRIDKMSGFIKNTPDWDNSIYALVVQNLNDLNKAKAEIRRLEEERGITPQ
jgi:hypothetical protein